MSLNIALEKITAQQPKERTRDRHSASPNDRSDSLAAVWMVGEQLKDMLRAEPHLAELVAQDLEVKEMSLAECERKIKDYADKHRTGNFACVIPSEAERIIREFYGLPRQSETAGTVVGQSPMTSLGPDLRLEDFF